MKDVLSEKGRPRETYIRVFLTEFLIKAFVITLIILDYNDYFSIKTSHCRNLFVTSLSLHYTSIILFLRKTFCNCSKIFIEKN